MDEPNAKIQKLHRYCLESYLIMSTDIHSALIHTSFTCSKYIECVSKITIFDLKMMVKSSLEKYLLNSSMRKTF